MNDATQDAATKTPGEAKASVTVPPKEDQNIVREDPKNPALGSKPEPKPEPEPQSVYERTADEKTADEKTAEAGDGNPDSGAKPEPAKGPDPKLEATVAPEVSIALRQQALRKDANDLLKQKCDKVGDQINAIMDANGMEFVIKHHIKVVPIGKG